MCCRAVYFGMQPFFKLIYDTDIIRLPSIPTRMRQLSGKVRKRKSPKAATLTRKNNRASERKAIRRLPQSENGKTKQTKRSVATSTDFDIASLSFKTLTVEQAGLRAKFQLYSKEYISELKAVTDCFRHLPEFKSILSVEKEWSLDEANRFITNAINNLYTKHNHTESFPDTVIISTQEVPDGLCAFSGINYDEPFVFIVDASYSTCGAIFISQFADIKNEKDRDIALKALKLISDDLEIPYWYNTEDWNYIQCYVKEDFERYEEQEPEERDDEDADPDEYMFPKYFNKRCEEWNDSCFNKLLVEYQDADYEDLYTRAYEQEDAMSIWLKAILYLQKESFSLFDYTFQLSHDNCHAGNSYTIFPHWDEHFFDYWDEFFNTHYQEGGFSGLVNKRIVNKEGIVCDTLEKKHIPPIVDLVFVFNPLENTFYGYRLSIERVETYSTYLNLSERERSLLLRIVENKPKR